MRLVPILVIIVFAPARSSTVAAPVAGHLHFTPTQAIQIASTFCHRIGLRVTHNPKARLPIPAGISHARGLTESYGQTHWRVSFQGKAEVEVDDRTRRVTFYENPSIARQRERMKNAERRRLQQQ